MDSTQRSIEQVHLDRTYFRLDELIEEYSRELRSTMIGPHGGTPQQITHRDNMVGHLEDRISTMRAVEDRLCFGRIDLETGARHYIGRIGITTDDERLLVDWRAPAAAAFYQATAIEPMDVVLRRHLSVRMRQVVAIEDDVLDLERLDDRDRATLNGEGALLNAITAPRTGRMQDIVATIQAEQDRIIRSDSKGVLVVQGGPGTGKTAVALQRAAYLLFTHRDTIARAGVLLIGPSRGFLAYISDVLPALGETGAVSLTIGDMFPSVSTQLEESAEVAAIKGDLRMADVIRTAVRNWQRVPDRDQTFTIDGEELVLPVEVVRRARDSARDSRKPHNRARVDFITRLLDHLARQLAMATGEEYDRDTRVEYFDELRQSIEIRRAINWCWLGLTPQSLLKQLFTDPAALAAAAPHLGADQVALLQREDAERWTVSDVPLLDEAEELLGDSGRDDARRRREQRRAVDDARREAKAVMDMYKGTDVFEWVSAGDLSGHYLSGSNGKHLADLAIGNRGWAFGHVVVDEAQELAPMMWRLISRRCPTRSMTVVGDLAQTSAPIDGSWEQRLPERVLGVPRVEQLSVNYRTPEQIMQLAVAVATEHGVQISPTRSVRVGEDPIQRRELVDGAVETAIRDAAARDEGQVLVVCPTADDAAAIAVPEALHQRVFVLSVRATKGLEYDHVVIVDPDAIVEGSPRGANDLYVAMTRATQTLTVLSRATGSVLRS